MTSTPRLYRASIAHFSKVSSVPKDDLNYQKDGGLVVQNKKILAMGEFSEMKASYPDALMIDYSGKLIVPGLIDSHLHFPQSEMIASYGEQLLTWLEQYTFPTESKFASVEYCQKMADIFVSQLVANGTTTALAFATVHAHSADALFEAASKRNMAMITGKVCMDRNCPDELSDNAESAFSESEALIKKWHGVGRNLYAITPRFAPTSTESQLKVLGDLAAAYPDTFIQTHLSENLDEIEWVKQLFPERSSYLDVYAHFGLLRKRAVFGHCVHMSDADWQSLADAEATAAFCPSSNLFLGSGFFDKTTADKFDVKQALASDVGAGTSFNLLRTYGEAYKISQVKGAPIDALNGLYMMTQGAASALGLDKDIGNLNPDSYADFIVLNPYFNDLSTLRIDANADCADILFALSILGDERCVEQTYIAGTAQLGSTNIHKEPVNAVA